MLVMIMGCVGLTLNIISALFLHGLRPPVRVCKRVWKANDVQSMIMDLKSRLLWLVWIVVVVRK